MFVNNQNPSNPNLNIDNLLNNATIKKEGQSQTVQTKITLGGKDVYLTLNYDSSKSQEEIIADLKSGPTRVKIEEMIKKYSYFQESGLANKSDFRLESKGNELTAKYTGKKNPKSFDISDGKTAGTAQVTRDYYETKIAKAKREQNNAGAEKFIGKQTLFNQLFQKMNPQAAPQPNLTVIPLSPLAKAPPAKEMPGNASPQPVPISSTTSPPPTVHIGSPVPLPHPVPTSTTPPPPTVHIGSPVPLPHPVPTSTTPPPPTINIGAPVPATSNRSTPSSPETPPAATGRATPPSPEISAETRGRTTPSSPETPPATLGRATPPSPETPPATLGRATPPSPETPATLQGHVTPPSPEISPATSGRTTPPSPEKSPATSGHTTPPRIETPTPTPGRSIPAAPIPEFSRAANLSKTARANTPPPSPGVTMTPVRKGSKPIDTSKLQINEELEGFNYRINKTELIEIYTRWITALAKGDHGSAMSIHMEEIEPLGNDSPEIVRAFSRSREADVILLKEMQAREAGDIGDRPYETTATVVSTPPKRMYTASEASQAEEGFKRTTGLTSSHFATGLEDKIGMLSDNQKNELKVRYYRYVAHFGTKLDMDAFLGPFPSLKKHVDESIAKDTLTYQTAQVTKDIEAASRSPDSKKRSDVQQKLQKKLEQEPLNLGENAAKAISQAYIGENDILDALGKIFERRNYDGQQRLNILKAVKESLQEEGALRRR